MFIDRKLLDKSVFYASGFCYTPMPEPMGRVSLEMILRIVILLQFIDAAELCVKMSRHKAVISSITGYNIFSIERNGFR